jgi:hypothetical protein
MQPNFDPNNKTTSKKWKTTKKKWKKWKMTSKKMEDDLNFFVFPTRMTTSTNKKDDLKKKMEKDLKTLENER